MKLSEADIRRLEQFLTRVQEEAYPEAPSDLHTDITKSMFAALRKEFDLPAGAKVLDVGCGQGVALEVFVAAGFKPIGITVNQEDLEACRAKGFDVREMDQSFLDFDDGEFDMVWCRHCLEHSIMPYFTLSQLVRVLKPGGGLYVEVPAPDTVSHHQKNHNHYSTLPKSAWLELIHRSGVDPVRYKDIKIGLIIGPDLYWAFWGRRKN